MNACGSSLLSTWVMAGATVGILVATIVYACFTKRLWEQTKRAAGQSENQLAVVREQVSLARHEVELRVRPYLKITAALEQTGPDVRVRVGVQNFGSAPGGLDTVRVRCLTEDEEVRDEAEHDSSGVVVFPGDTVEIASRLIGGPYGRGVREGLVVLRLEAEVEYLGPWEGHRHITGVEMRYESGPDRFVTESMVVRSLPANEGSGAAGAR